MTDLSISVRDANGNIVPLKLTLDSDGITYIPHNIIDALPSLPAGTNTLGLVDIAPISNIQRASISYSNSGDNIVIASVAGVKTKILGLLITPSADVTIQFKSGASAISGVISLLAKQQYLLPMTQPGYHWLETTINTNFVISLGTSVQISGFLVYVQS